MRDTSSFRPSAVPLGSVKATGPRTEPILTDVNEYHRTARDRGTCDVIRLLLRFHSRRFSCLSFMFFRADVYVEYPIYKHRMASMTYSA